MIRCIHPRLCKENPLFVPD
uniref:Uncharacterized protein n=1 Tax=Arundo donax TaxID=35708 RepID=A0A0A9B9X4_ARUDO